MKQLSQLKIFAVLSLATLFACATCGKQHALQMMVPQTEKEEREQLAEALRQSIELKQGEEKSSQQKITPGGPSMDVAGASSADVAGASSALVVEVDSKKNADEKAAAELKKLITGFVDPDTEEGTDYRYTIYNSAIVAGKKIVSANPNNMLVLTEIINALTNEEYSGRLRHHVLYFVLREMEQVSKSDDIKKTAVESLSCLNYRQLRAVWAQAINDGDIGRAKTVAASGYVVKNTLFKNFRDTGGAIEKAIDRWLLSQEGEELDITKTAISSGAQEFGRKAGQAVEACNQQ